MHTFLIGIALGVTGVLLWPASPALAALTAVAGTIAALISSD